MSTAETALLLALAVYAVAVLVYARMTLRTPAGPRRTSRALRLLVLVSLGAPLAAALALVAG